MNLLAFDIETVPDVDNARSAYGLDGLDDEGVANALFQMRRQQTGSDFLKLHLHRVVAISVVLRTGDSVRVWSLGSADSPEEELLRRFFEGLERYSPTLVSWNGGGFDLPVLQYRSLVHGVQAPHYWESGDNAREFRFNNYRNRYHDRHTDLMDVLSMFQARATVPLEEIASTLGLPGKMGMHGGAVWGKFVANEHEAIRNYCETDALNTYLVHLRFELIRGNLTQRRFAEECALVRDTLTESGAPHWREFLEQWRTRDAWCGEGERGRATDVEQVNELNASDAMEHFDGA